MHVVMCCTPFALRKAQKSSLVKQGPLSVTTECGKPNWANVTLSCQMVASAVADDIGKTSNHLVCASINAKNIWLLMGPA